MRALTCRLVLAAALATPSGVEAADCRELVLQDLQGGGLEACPLLRVIERADLRRRFSSCVEQLLSGPRRVFGGLRFGVTLDAWGRMDDLHLEPSAFDRTRLPGCLAQALRRAFSGTAEGERRVRLDGRLFVPSERPEAFVIELSVPLRPAAEPLPPLVGGFLLQAEGFTAECPADENFRLHLLLSDGAPASVGERRFSTPPPKPVLVCQEKQQRALLEGAPAIRRELFHDACRCLASLLASAYPEARITAAEALITTGCWNERRRLFRMVRREFGLPQRAAKDDPTHVEPSDESGRLRLLQALVQGGWKLPKGALEKLAAESSSAIRHRLLQDVLLKHPSLFPQVADAFWGSEDSLLLARAANLGCWFGQGQAQLVFRRLLAAGSEGTAVLALLHAPACLRGAQRLEAMAQVAGRALPELLLMRLSSEAAGAADPQRLTGWLEHPCPIVRFLAGEVIALYGTVSREKLEELQNREQDTILRERLDALVAGRPLPTWTVQQLWLEGTAAPLGEDETPTANASGK